MVVLPAAALRLFFGETGDVVGVVAARYLAGVGDIRYAGKRSIREINVEVRGIDDLGIFVGGAVCRLGVVVFKVIFRFGVEGVRDLDELGPGRAVVLRIKDIEGVVEDRDLVALEVYAETGQRRAADDRRAHVILVVGSADLYVLVVLGGSVV